MSSDYNKGRKDMALDVIKWMNEVSACGMNISAMAKKSAEFNTWLQNEAKK